ncbi:hypothetical protein HELRODRAFT_162559 [Helobdella robusta]|uniref:Uncharacterized protein n=1 Tax=Helobdella robusta TaxID=6412 RepID=T1ESU2_HELRO|nr:hypothetical protein HELRODRAFT_162559 [Helobdella robusta]ESN99075.1 hypothetical protein HELRODRAFT_162559 [Helobdella robusta]
MAAPGDGAISINALKVRMQEVSEELSKYKTLFEASEKELEIEKAKTKALESEARELNHKVSLMENEYDQQAAKYVLLCEKLEETIKVAEECDKQRKLLDQKRVVDEERLAELEQIFRETSEIAFESEKKYDEVSRKLAASESDLEKDLAKTEAAELNVKNLQDDLKTMSAKLKSMQARVDKAATKEANFDKTIEDLRNQLKTCIKIMFQAEDCGNEADKTTCKLQRELDQLQDHLLQIKMQCQVLKHESDPRDISFN